MLVLILTVRVSTAFPTGCFERVTLRRFCATVLYCRYRLIAVGFAQPVTVYYIMSRPLTISISDLFILISDSDQFQNVTELVSRFVKIVLAVMLMC